MKPVVISSLCPIVRNQVAALTAARHFISWRGGPTRSDKASRREVRAKWCCLALNQTFIISPSPPKVKHQICLKHLGMDSGGS